jgi:hypothetical protein
MKIISDERWWLTDDGKRVRDKHPLARRLLVGKGSEIEESELEKYPILDEEFELKAVAEPPDTKAIEEPEKAKARLRKKARDD